MLSGKSAVDRSRRELAVLEIREAGLRFRLLRLGGFRVACFLIPVASMRLARSLRRCVGAKRVTARSETSQYPDIIAVKLAGRLFTLGLGILSGAHRHPNARGLSLIPSARPLMRARRRA